MAFQDLPNTVLEAALEYDFITEISPGVWKICRRLRRIEYLAYDITDQLFTDPEQPERGGTTALWDLMQPDRPENLLKAFVPLLAHDNLVNLVDVIQVRRTNFGGPHSRERWYTVWDFCDAGNLENLFVPATGHQGLSTKNGKSRFLPESFCWHVLTSVLNALTWLHEGTTTMVFNETLGQNVEMGPYNPDWQPILHRNMDPKNIFFMHPKRTEPYGLCKLGNFGEAFVSGHNPVVAEDDPDNGWSARNPQGPQGRYILSPPRGESFVPLEKLREKDCKYADTHPPMADQPYTLISEYRAVGEIIQAMMVPPEDNGVDHMKNIRSRSVRDNLRTADYSTELLRFVYWLMELSLGELILQTEHSSGWSRDAQNGPLVSGCTGALFLWAYKSYYTFRDNNADGEIRRQLIFGEAINQENADEVAKQQMLVDSNDLMKTIMDKQDKLFGDTPRGFT